MPTPERCKGCPLLFCDFISKECRLSVTEVVSLRPELIATTSQRKRQAQAKWREANREKALAYDRQRYANNREAGILRALDYQKRNPEKRAAAQKRYQQKRAQRVA